MSAHITVIAIEVAGIVREVRLENIEPPVAIVVGHGHAHSRLFVSILAVGASRHHSHVREGAIVIVAKQNTGLGVDGDVDVGPAIVVEVAGNCRD